jgi:D-lactate dehydrogenase
MCIIIKMKIAFFEIRPQEQEFLTQALPGHELFFSDQILTPDKIPANVKDAEVISTHTNSKIDANLIAAFPNLKLVATRTTGFDHVDCEAAKAKNITVCNVPFYGENTVAEFAFGLILALARKIPQAIAIVKFTHKFDFEGLQGFDLKGKTLGVVGTGHIGAHIIKMAKGFEMEVVGFDAFPNEELSEQLGFAYMPLDQLLQKSDIVTIHVPSIPQTKHMINSTNMPNLKHGAAIINTARGAVIETKALYDAVKSGQISFAGLDVLEDEEAFKPVPQPGDPENVRMDRELMDLDNVFITPHTAFNTIEAEHRILQTTADNINAFMKGTPQNKVPPPPPAKK